MTVDVLAQFTTQMAPMLAAIDTTSVAAAVLDRESRALKEGLKRLQVIQPQRRRARRGLDALWIQFRRVPRRDWIGIGLDWFMGSEHPMHAELPPSSRFPAYRLAHAP